MFLKEFFKELAGIVCHAFEAFSRGCILLELNFSSYNLQLFSSYKPLFRVTEFAHHLRMFSRSYPYF